MKKLSTLIIASASLGIGCEAIATTLADCRSQNPQGADAVITCLAAANGGQTAEAYWNSVLFNSTLGLDQACNTALSSTASTAQNAMYATACNTQKGSYFSYANFKAADQSLADTLGGKYTFLRSSNFDLNAKELANFLATAALETSGNGAIPGTQYTNDGLYFRYEGGALSSDACYKYPANPDSTAQSQVALTPKGGPPACPNTALSTFYTKYFPPSQAVVAQSISDPTQSYTGYLMDLDTEYRLDITPATVMWPGTPSILTNGTVAQPLEAGKWTTLSGYKWVFLNSLIDPGYWIGIGPIQLTGDAVFKFFGWYHQNGKLSGASATPIASGDFNAFVTSLLTDGKLGWQGSLWYWNYKITGGTAVGSTVVPKPTVHEVVAGSTIAACHDIAIVTYMVNGGCNNYEARKSYYTYYMGKFGLPVTAVSYTYNGITSNSLICDDPNSSPVIPATLIGGYCGL